MIYDYIVRAIAKAVGIVSPATASAYLRNHHQLRQYDAGKSTGIDRRWGPTNLTGDREIGEDWRKVTDKSRDVVRNNGYLANALRIGTAFTVGTAIWPKPRVRKYDGTVDKVASRIIQDEHARWAEKCCVNGMDWDDLKKLIYRHWKNDGEVIIHKASTEIHPYQFELLEPDQIDESIDDFGGLTPAGRGTGNRCVRGIEFNRYGRPVAYWILDAHPGDAVFSTTSRRIPADQIIHVFDRNRATETRGICDFVSSIIPIYSHQQHRYAVMDLLRIAAAYGIFIESDYPEDFFSDPNVEQNPDPSSKLYAPKAYASPAGIHVLRKGERMSFAKPEQPTAEFNQVEQSHLRMAAAGAGQSYETFTGDLSNVNYSSLRGGQGNERTLFRMASDLIIRKFAGPTYPEWMDTEVLRGTLRLPGYWTNRAAYQAVSWSLPGFPSTDQLKEETADQMALANKTTTRRIICERKGFDWDEICEELESENKAMIDRKIDPNFDASVEPGLLTALLGDQSTGGTK